MPMDEMHRARAEKLGLSAEQMRALEALEGERRELWDRAQSDLAALDRWLENTDQICKLLKLYPDA